MWCADYESWREELVSKVQEVREMTKISEVIKATVEGMADEWAAKSTEEIRAAILNDEWVDFEVAQALRSPNYTLVPVDFYERIGRAVEESLKGDANVRV